MTCSALSRNGDGKPDKRTPGASSSPPPWMDNIVLVGWTISVFGKQWLNNVASSLVISSLRLWSFSLCGAALQLDIVSVVHILWM